MIWIVLIFIVFSSILEGVSDHFSKNWDDALGFDKHVLYWLLRGLFGVFVCVTMWEPMFLIGCLCLFPFLHDGLYYITRNILEGYRIYTGGWFSGGDKYWKGFDKESRTILFIISLILIFVS